MRRFLLTVATAASALAVTSCGDSTGISGNVAGTYELRTINGQSLPVTFSDNFGTITFVAGEIDLDSDGSFVDTIQYREDGSTLVRTDQTFGTWTRSGDRIILETDDGFEYELQRTSSSRLVQDDGTGFRLVYQRF